MSSNFKGYRDPSGKWVAEDGLVSKGGYRRIVPNADDKRWLDENNAATLRDTAAQVLRGRNATIFEHCILNLGVGDYGSAVKDMAARFGIPVKRVYKILDTCKQRVKRAIREPQRKRRFIRWRWRKIREYIKGREHLPDSHGGQYIDYFVHYDEYE